ncbi:MAG: STAS domain-containing protein [Anaerolineales bacterium]|nr:MAG: STAS domain-containing protein [Anaerolineales bacterium]
MNAGYWETAPNIHLLSLSGALNASRAESAVQLFRDVSERGVHSVVVNLEDVPFIDSRGLAALIAGYRIFGSDPHNFQLTGIQDQPRLLFELTGFDQVFEFVPHIPGLTGYRWPVFAPRPVVPENLVA